MSNKIYMLIRIIVVIIVAILVAWSVNSGNWLIPIPVAIAGMVILLLFRKGVKEITVDERTASRKRRPCWLSVSSAS